MYVLSGGNKRVSVQLLGKEKIEDKLSRFEELKSASVSYLGIGSPGGPDEIGAAVPNLKELDLTGNLISDWKDVGVICEQLPHLVARNLSNNLMMQNPTGLPFLRGIRVLVLNYTGINWSQVEILEHSLPVIEELCMIGNNISTISLEQLYLNKNKLTSIFYPDDNKIKELLNNYDSCEESYLPFQNLCCLLLGSNNISDLASIDSLNSFPKLIISARERKESEIWYVRLVMSKLLDSPEEIRRLHPRFFVLKNFHGIEDERPFAGATGPQRMSSGLLSVTLKHVGPSIGEKLPLTKKLPATTTVGKLKGLCESFLKLKSMKLKLFLHEEGSTLPILLDDEIASLMDIGVGSGSTILVDEES